MRAPRAFASSMSSRISAPAPSPRTNPSRVRSNGRDTVLIGWPGRGVPMPRMLVKPMWTSSKMGDSDAPVMTAVQSPRLITSAASPMAVVPIDQAVGDEERADQTGALVLPGRLVADEEALTAAAGAVYDADVVAVLIVDYQPGIGEGHLGGGHRKLNIVVRAAGILEIHPASDVEVTDLAAGLVLVGSGVEVRDLADAASAVDEAIPYGVEALAHGANHPHPRYCNSSRVVRLAHLLWSSWGSIPPQLSYQRSVG